MKKKLNKSKWLYLFGGVLLVAALVTGCRTLMDTGGQPDAITDEMVVESAMKNRKRIYTKFNITDFYHEKGDPYFTIIDQNHNKTGEVQTLTGLKTDNPQLQTVSRVTLDEVQKMVDVSRGVHNYSHLAGYRTDDYLRGLGYEDFSSGSITDVNGEFIAKIIHDNNQPILRLTPLNGEDSQWIVLGEKQLSRLIFWSQNDPIIVYAFGSGLRGGLPSIWKVNIQTGEATLLEELSKSYIDGPFVSPDGRWLSYTGYFIKEGADVIDLEDGIHGELRLEDPRIEGFGLFLYDLQNDRNILLKELQNGQWAEIRWYDPDLSEPPLYNTWPDFGVGNTQSNATQSIAGLGLSFPMQYGVPYCCSRTYNGSTPTNPLVTTACNSVPGGNYNHTHSSSHSSRSAIDLTNKWFDVSGTAFTCAQEPIFAAADGVVIREGWQKQYGNVVYIAHGIDGDGDSGNDPVTVYAHLSASFVKNGDVVNRHDLIGLEGTTGEGTGEHIHLELRQNHGNASNLNVWPEFTDIIDPAISGQQASLFGTPIPNNAYQSSSPQNVITGMAPGLVCAGATTVVLTYQNPIVELSDWQKNHISVYDQNSNVYHSGDQNKRYYTYSRVTSYGGSTFFEPGPEKVYEIQIPGGGELTVNLKSLKSFTGWDDYQVPTSGSGGSTVATSNNQNPPDLDVFILGSCDPSSNIANTSGVTAVATVTTGTYYVVVDGALNGGVCGTGDGYTGEYKIEFDFAPCIDLYEPNSTQSLALSNLGFYMGTTGPAAMYPQALQDVHSAQSIGNDLQGSNKVVLNGCFADASDEEYFMIPMAQTATSKIDAAVTSGNAQLQFYFSVNGSGPVSGDFASSDYECLTGCAELYLVIKPNSGIVAGEAWSVDIEYDHNNVGTCGLFTSGSNLIAPAGNNGTTGGVVNSIVSSTVDPCAPPPTTSNCPEDPQGGNHTIGTIWDAANSLSTVNPQTITGNLQLAHEDWMRVLTSYGTGNNVDIDFSGGLTGYRCQVQRQDATGWVTVATLQPGQQHSFPMTATTSGVIL
ncbi:MAG: M23 family metallopeptidase, partial [Bacteroidota bacterium]